jgi:predicted nuclease with RNAse H fold
MSRALPGPVVVGVDVGPKKGFHTVSFEGQFLEKIRHAYAAEGSWCGDIDASVVGIDAPCCWSRTGRARSCEREMADEGLHAFATPDRAVGELNPFFGWMRNGDALYRRIKHHYPLFDGTLSTSRPVCFETFPHAVAYALAGKILSAKHKRVDRPRLLREAGLSTESLTNIDMVDAALCALTYASWPGRSRPMATAWLHPCAEDIALAETW